VTNRLKLFFSAAVVAGIAIAGGCGSDDSSNNNNGGNQDASTPDGSHPGDDLSDGGGSSCQIGVTTGCAATDTCCFDPGALLSGSLDFSALANLTSGTCMAPAACTTGFSLGCTSKSACGSQLCCATLAIPGGLLDAAAAFDASGFDGNFPQFDGNFADIDASGTGLTVACAATCEIDAQHTQLCSADTDCPTGYKCQAAAGPAATIFGGLKACTAPPADAGSDAGTTTVSDAGDAGTTTTDAGTAGDAGGDAGDGG